MKTAYTVWHKILKKIMWVSLFLGSDEGIKEGSSVKLTGRVAEVPVGDALIGRVVNALGQAY